MPTAGCAYMYADGSSTYVRVHRHTSVPLASFTYEVGHCENIDERASSDLTLLKTTHGDVFLKFPRFGDVCSMRGPNVNTRRTYTGFQCSLVRDCFRDGWLTDGSDKLSQHEYYFARMTTLWTLWFNGIMT